MVRFFKKRTSLKNKEKSQEKSNLSDLTHARALTPFEVYQLESQLSHHKTENESYLYEDTEAEQAKSQQNDLDQTHNTLIQDKASSFEQQQSINNFNVNEKFSPCSNNNQTFNSSNEEKNSSNHQNALCSSRNFTQNFKANEEIKQDRDRQNHGYFSAVNSDNSNIETTELKEEQNRPQSFNFDPKQQSNNEDEPLLSHREPINKSNKLSWFDRLYKGLAKTSLQLSDAINTVLTKRKLNDATLEDLEDILIANDLGIETTEKIIGTISEKRYGKDISGDEIRFIMQEKITEVLSPVAQTLKVNLNLKPHVILIVGVNGTGKTTTIGKLASKFSQQGLKVMLAAGDTFRAAAIEQLNIWGERTHSTVISSKSGSDAASIAYDAYLKAKDQQSDVLIIDTAGRLHNKIELMEELTKIIRVLKKIDNTAPHTTLQTLDATTGQNALLQVEMFQKHAQVNGLVMTKLDGTARGGILIAIAAKYKLPVYFIGVGEDMNDLEPFKSDEFAKAISGL